MVSYFAYGSNLSERQMLERCPDAKLVGKYVLKNYRLAFDIFSPKRECGCADILPSLGDEVWGLVYELTPKDLQSLDEYEAHPLKYKRFSTLVVNELGEERKVETYEVVDKENIHLPPSQEYLNIISNAADKYSFPETYKTFLKSFTTI